MRKGLILFLAVILVLLSFSSVFAEGSMSNFSQSRQYDGRFTDVKTSDWFYQYVTAAYEYGLVSGNSATTFNPNGNVTIAETLVIACQINSIYYGNTVDKTTASGSAWYQPYVNYAINNGIINSGDYEKYNIAATRVVFAKIMASTLPDEALAAICHTAVIPDVARTDKGADSIYKLYDAGIISGSDEKGTFHPNSNIKRSEVSVIALNLVDANRRKPNNLGGNDSAQNKLDMLEIAIYSPYDPIAKTYHEFEVDENTGALIATAGERVEFEVVDNHNIVETVEWRCANKNIQIEPLASDKNGVFHCYVIGLGACDVEVTTIIKYMDGGSDMLGDLLSFKGLVLSEDDIVIRIASPSYLLNTETSRQFLSFYCKNSSGLPIQLPESIVVDGRRLSSDKTVELSLDAISSYGWAPYKTVHYCLPAGVRVTNTWDVGTASLVIVWGGEEYYIECNHTGITYFKKGNKR